MGSITPHLHSQIGSNVQLCLYWKANQGFSEATSPHSPRVREGRFS
jgi:hypothetical protein